MRSRKLIISLEGKTLKVVGKQKMHCGYALVRTGSGDDARWLLIKMDDEEADARRNPTSTESKSVATGKTLEEISLEEGGTDG